MTPLTLDQLAKRLLVGAIVALLLALVVPGVPAALAGAVVAYALLVIRG